MKIEISIIFTTSLKLWKIKVENFNVFNTQMYSFQFFESLNLCVNL